MNIFYLDHDPKVAAQCLFDVHVRKMLVESCQLLANAYTTKELSKAPKTQKGTVRKHTHMNHPCTKWVTNSLNNFIWLVNYASELDNEYFWRFRNHHFCCRFIDWCRENPPCIPYRAGTSDFPIVVSKDCQSILNVVVAYRAYYVTKKFNKNGINQAVWTRRAAPSWWFDFYDFGSSSTVVSKLNTNTD